MTVATDLEGRVRSALAGRYDVERELGRGGMAVVYLAREGKHEREVAVKVLRPEVAAYLGSERFVREIRILASLQHPHILPLLDSGEVAVEGDSRCPFLVMPFIRGESLRERLRRSGPLTVEQATRIARDVAEALAYAHRQGVVHRDIKPENVLLEGDRAVVADFGIARAIDRSATDAISSSGLAVGTPAYMSPEQACGQGPVDGRSDLYSLGCVLYEMLTGQPPFLASTPQAIIARHLADPPPPIHTVRPAVPPAVERAVGRALAKTPADRFATAEELGRALDPAAGRPGGRGVALLPWGVVVLAAVSVGALVLRSRGPPAPAGLTVAVLSRPGPAPAGGASGGALAAASLAAVAAQLPGLAALEHATTASDAALGPKLFRAAAARGARLLAVPEVDSSPGGWRAAITVHAIPEGSILGRVDGGAPQPTPERAVDRAVLSSLRLLSDRDLLHAGAAGGLARTTASAAALTRLLSGQRRLGRGDVRGAVADFREAVARDPECGPAWYRLSVALAMGPVHDYAGALAAVAEGIARRDLLVAPWPDLLLAQRHYLRRDGDSAVAAFQATVLDENATNADGWLGLGESLFHFAAVTGHPATDAAQPLERVVALDSTFAPVYDHLVDLALTRGDTVAARHWLARMRPYDPARPARLAALALRGGSPAERAHTLAWLADADRYVLSDLVALLVRDSSQWPLSDSIARYLTAPTRTPGDRLRGAEYRLVVLGALDRWPEAVAAWRQSAGGTAFDSWMVHAALAGSPAGEFTDPMLAWARKEMRAGRSPDFGRPTSDDLQQGFYALVHLALLDGSRAEVDELLSTLERRTPPDSADPGPDALRATLDARRALLAADTATAIAALTTAVRRGAEPYDTYFPLTAMAPERLLLAELLGAQGDRRGAARWLASFRSGWAIGDVLYARRIRNARQRLGL